MAIKYQCDRCGQQQDVRLYDLREDSELSSSVQRLWDSQKPLPLQQLCINCTRELGEWQRNPKKKYQVQVS
jgi:hypothetical protein